MKYASELKIGITGIITIVVIIWGINYLKGRNILSSTYTIHALYGQVDGLEASANVMMEGFKIGTVDRVVFEPGKPVPFSVSMDIEKKYNLKHNSVAEIYSADLLGSKAIRIIGSDEDYNHEPGDTLVSSVAGDIISSLLGDITPLLGSVNDAVRTLDSVAGTIEKIVSDPSVMNILKDIEGASSSIERQLSPDGEIYAVLENFEELSTMLSQQSVSIETTIQNLEEVSEQVANAGLDTLIQQLSETSANLASITSSIQDANGSVGKLIYEDSLYQQLSSLIIDLDSLVRDVNANPKKYVGFSVFGN